MEHMKKLEGEVRDELRQLGETQELLERGGLTVDPHQFLGLEINPRAVAIAELVLWIGYLKWHLRTLGHAPNEPLLRAFNNIKEQDAVLAYDRKEIVTDDAGKPVSRWDGHTMKVSPVTGEEVPDEAERVPVYRYVNPRKAEWPKADYVVGNPPFIGDKMMKNTLGPGYVAALRETYPELSESTDYVLYWWFRSAEWVRKGNAKRFGLIATNSIRQTFNRCVMEEQLAAAPSLSLAFAIPDHPWVDAADGASVRISMTVGLGGTHQGRLCTVSKEFAASEDGVQVEIITSTGTIQADLTAGAAVAAARPLQSSFGICCPGVKLFGGGFIVTRNEAKELGLGRVPGLEQYIKPLRNGRDFTQACRDVLAIDAFGLSVSDLIHTPLFGV
jgi:hypothetical protein